MADAGAGRSVDPHRFRKLADVRELLSNPYNWETQRGKIPGKPSYRVIEATMHGSAPPAFEAVPSAAAEVPPPALPNAAAEVPPPALPNAAAEVPPPALPNAAPLPPPVVSRTTTPVPANMAVILSTAGDPQNLGARIGVNPSLYYNLLPDNFRWYSKMRVQKFNGKISLSPPPPNIMNLMDGMLDIDTSRQYKNFFYAPERDTIPDRNLEFTSEDLAVKWNQPSDFARATYFGINELREYDFRESPLQARIADTKSSVANLLDLINTEYKPTSDLPIIVYIVSCDVHLKNAPSPHPDYVAALLRRSRYNLDPDNGVPSSHKKWVDPVHIWRTEKRNEGEEPFNPFPLRGQGTNARIRNARLTGTIVPGREGIDRSSNEIERRYLLNEPGHNPHGPYGRQKPKRVEYSRNTRGGQLKLHRRTRKRCRKSKKHRKTVSKKGLAFLNR